MLIPESVPDSERAPAELGGRERARDIDIRPYVHIPAFHVTRGTHRSAGGLLDDNAGRHPEFDSLASRFIVATSDARGKLVEDAKLFARATGEKYKYYLKVMDKVINGSEEWVEKEATRLASILKKRNISPQKLDEVKIKANILSSFKAVEEKAEEVVEEVKEKVEEVIGRASAEL